MKYLISAEVVSVSSTPDYKAFHYQTTKLDLIVEQKIIPRPKTSQTPWIYFRVNPRPDGETHNTLFFNLFL